MKKKCIKGIGLLELMLSLSILSILMLSIFSYYRISQTAQKINSAVQIIGNLLIASEDWLSTYHTFTHAKDLQGKNLSINIPSLIEQGKLPQNFCSNQDCSEHNVNPWGGAIILTPKNANQIEIVFYGLPKQSFGKGICRQISDLLKEKVISDCTQALQGEYRLTYVGA